jgi:hypothetical protein
MPRHSIERDARGRVADISGSCGSERCPVEDVDDDGSVEYRCPESGAVLADEAAVDDPDVPDDRTPATTDDLTIQERRRRGKRHQ